MKILMISGITPSKNRLFGGSFISKRYEKMKENICVDLYKVGNMYSRLYSKIYKSIKKVDLEDDTEILLENAKWNNINIKVSLITKLLEKYMNNIYYKTSLKYIERHIEIKKYNLIHAHWVYPTGYIAMLLSKKYNIPYIITAHGSDIHTIPKENTKIAKCTLEILENANKVVFVSDRLKRDALDLGYSGNNAEVIYNGVELNDFKELNKEEVKLDLGFDGIVIGYIGRLEPTKGADRLPRIFNEINKLKEDIEFLIIGDGSLKENIIKELDELKIKYRYCKSMEHKKLNKYMNSCDAIVVPSRNESFCCVALEAQACGTKVVASNVGGISEAIGKFGFLVDSGENFERRFAETVNYCLNENINIYDMKKRTHEFSWERTVKEELNIYEEVLNLGSGK